MAAGDGNRGAATGTEAMRRVIGGSRRRRWPLVLALVLAAGIAGGFAWWRQAASASSAITYVTEPVARGALAVTVTATGTVQPTTQVDVSSELSGMLAAVEVDDNASVEAGQVLARLDDTKLKAQMINAQAALAAGRARLEQAEATLVEARANGEAQRQLVKRGVAGARETVTTAAAEARAAAAVDLAKADIMLAEANLALQQADLDKALIRSPIKGIVLKRSAEPGQIVAAALNAPVLFQIAQDLRRMELRVDIDEAEIGRVAVGNDAAFTVDAYPGRPFKATIIELRYAPESADGVVTYKAVLSVDNDEQLLRPGMTATAVITVATVENALLVPNAALRYAPPVTAAAERRSGTGLLGLVMPRRPSGRPATRAERKPGVDILHVLRGGEAVRVEVKAGDTDGIRTAVTGEGLAEGDAVITDQARGG